MKKSYKEDIEAIKCYSEYLEKIEPIKCYNEESDDIEAIQCNIEHFEQIEAIQRYIEHLEEIKFNLQAMQFYIMYLQDMGDEDSIIKDTNENFINDTL